MVCIYCERDLPRSGFSREHVVPRAFGAFERSLTLHEVVCSECNQYFGDTIDFALARGSVEAVLRLATDVKSHSETDELRRERIRFAWMAMGDWHGLILQLVAHPDGLVAEPVPQVGFATPTGDKFVFVPEEMLRDAAQPLPEVADPKQGLLLVANSADTQQRLVEVLNARGIRFQEHRRAALPTQPDLVEIRATLDSLVLRCVAKIAFNYLAYTQPGGFALREDFSVIRGFIRYNRHPPYPVIHVDSQPILGDDTVTQRRTNGHLVTVDWALDGTSIVAQVSLFNQARYAVSLVREFRGVWWWIRSGYHFDIERRTVEPLLGTSVAPPGGTVFRRR